jgi:hypothetical protein
MGRNRIKDMEELPPSPPQHRITHITSHPICKNQAVYCPQCRDVIAHGVKDNKTITIGEALYEFTNPLVNHKRCGSKLVQIALSSEEYSRWRRKYESSGGPSLSLSSFEETPCEHAEDLTQDCSDSRKGQAGIPVCESTRVEIGARPRRIRKDSEVG